MKRIDIIDIKREIDEELLKVYTVLEYKSASNDKVRNIYLRDVESGETIRIRKVE